MKISIIGAAGTVGSCAAFLLAERGLADEIVLVSRRANLAANLALDIAAAQSGRRSVRLAGGQASDLAGSDIVVIAAGVHFAASAPVASKLEANIPLLRRIAADILEYCPQAVVITATNPVDLMNYGLYLATSLDRRRLIGLNTNDALRFRMVMARSLGVDPARLEAPVMGEHPRAPLLVFSRVRLDGRLLPVDEAVKNEVRAEIRRYLGDLEALQAGRSAGWTTAAGLAEIVRAVVEDSGPVLSCSAVLEGEYGLRGLSAGVPAVIGRSGIREILEWELEESERRELGEITTVLSGDTVLLRRLISPGTV